LPKFLRLFERSEIQFYREKRRSQDFTVVCMSDAYFMFLLY